MNTVINKNQCQFYWPNCIAAILLLLCHSLVRSEILFAIVQSTLLSVTFIQRLRAMQND